MTYEVACLELCTHANGDSSIAYVRSKGWADHRCTGTAGRWYRTQTSKKRRVPRRVLPAAKPQTVKLQRTNSRQ